MEMNNFLNIGVWTIHLFKNKEFKALMSYQNKLIEKNYPVAKEWTIDDTIV